MSQETTKGTKGSVDVGEAFQKLLDAHKCERYKDVLLGISKKVCFPPSPKQGADITTASRRVCKGVRERDAARSRLERVPLLRGTMLQNMRELQESIPALSQRVQAAELELGQARGDNERALRQVEPGQNTIDDDTFAIVEDIQSQIVGLQKQLEAVRAFPRVGQQQPQPGQQQPGQQTGLQQPQPTGHQPGQQQWSGQQQQGHQGHSE